MAIDEATSAMLQAMAAQGAPPMSELEPAMVRAGGLAAAEMNQPGPDLAEVHDHEVDVPGATITVRSYNPGNARGAIVYFHGGGWVLGSIAESDAVTRTLAARTGAIVYSVGYRLAPENPYPAAPNDAWAATLWAANDIATRAPGAPLLVAGESAGGTLAAVVAQRAAQEGGPAIAAQVLIYPATDSDMDRPSYVAPENQLMLSKDTMIWFWDHYATPEQRSEPAASPLRAETLAGLPAALVISAEHDPLLDEGEAYADRLLASGVAVRKHRFDGQVHGFYSMPDYLPAAALAMDAIVDYVDGVLGGDQPS